MAGPEAAPGAEAATAPAVEEGAVVEAPAEAAPVTVALSGDALAEAEKTFQRRCTRCHAIVAVENKLAEYRKKGQTEKIVLEMKAVPNSGIRKKDVPVIVDYINASY
ncbi:MULTISPECIES: photosystem P840 reaction-center cytochrome c-551 [Prosthecochloris]|uniref:photosystem P840 reaction-center cytochrome c-551 n=1 Tax=Prosthecochloris sp. TaxID=290513 RepID=UPI0031334048